MKSAVDNTTNIESLVSEVADRFTEEVKQGLSPSIEGYAEQHPEIAGIIRQVFPALAVLDVSASGVQLAGNEERGVTGQLGDFRILGELGRGGMGVVYEAEQISIGRHVALKVLPFAAMLDKQQLNRFKNEARAAGTLDHPNIVSVFSVGTVRGVHYYAMQLVEGLSLAEVIADLRKSQGMASDEQGPVDGHTITFAGKGLPPTHKPSEQLSSAPVTSPTADTKPALQASISTVPKFDTQEFFRSVAELGIQAAQALDHAHKNGIVHRDVKPGNLLVDADGKLWVTDFGLARIDADAGMTMTGDLLGTLRYMSPEQALAKPEVVDHRTDIYSLGATLYELLALRPAYEGADRQELLRQIAFEDTRRLRQLNSHIPVDLETIVAKSMEKNPADRYTTAKELANDLRHHLDNRPILAKPPSLTNRLKKLSRRHVGVMWTLVLASLAMAVAFGVGAAMIAASRNLAEQERMQAEQERGAAIKQRNVARRNLYYSEMLAGQSDVANQNPAGLYDRLVNYLPLPGEEDHRDWEWYYLMSRCRPEVRTLGYPGATRAAWSPDGEYIGGPGWIWQAETGECIRRFDTMRQKGVCVAWSPDGEKFAWGTSSDDSAVYIWDRSTDSVSRLAGHENTIWCVAWSPDGSQIASGSYDKTIKIWDVASKTVQWSVSPPFQKVSLDWSPDGKLLAVGLNYGGGIRVWDVLRRELVTERPSSSRTHKVSWHPQGNMLAVCEPESWYLLNRDDWSVKHQQEISRGGAAIAYSPDGSKIAVTHGEAVTIWDSAGKTKLAELNGHRLPVRSVSWSPEGRRLVTTGGWEIKLWDLDQHEQPPRIESNTEIRSLAWLVDNKTLVTVAQEDGSRSFWHTSDGSLQKREAVIAKAPLCFSPDRRLAAVLMDDERTVSILDASTGATRAVLQQRPSHSLVSFAFSTNGARAVTQTAVHQKLQLDFWDVDGERPLSSWTGERKFIYERETFRHLVWSRDGKYVAAAGVGDVSDSPLRYWRTHLHVFDVKKGVRILKLIRDEPNLVISSIAWSRDGRFLAFGTSEGRLEVVNLENGRLLIDEKIHRGRVRAISWHPDGKRLACSADDGHLKLVTADSGHVLLTFSFLQEHVTKLAWSDDGLRLAGATSTGQIHVWDASRGHALSVADVPRRDELAWAYYDRASRSAAQEFEGALREFLAHAPDTLGFWDARGVALAQLGDFDRAFEEFSKGVEPDEEYGFEAARARAYALLGAGDVDRYREACAQLVDDFPENPALSNRGLVAWLCTLAPNPKVDSKQVLQMARASHDASAIEGEDELDLILGACLYRDGQYDEAVRVLTQLVAKLERGSDSTDRFQLACAKYFQSLARFEIGHAFQARRLLKEANRTAAEYSRRASYSYRYWMRPVVLDALRRAATSAIGK